MSQSASCLGKQYPLADTKAERLIVHEELVKLATEALAAIESFSEVGVTPQSDFLAAKL